MILQILFRHQCLVYRAPQLLIDLPLQKNIFLQLLTCLIEKLLVSVTFRPHILHEHIYVDVFNIKIGNLVKYGGCIAATYIWHVLLCKLCRIAERLEAAAPGKNRVTCPNRRRRRIPIGNIIAIVRSRQPIFLTWIISQKLWLTLIRVTLEHNLGDRNRRIHVWRETRIVFLQDQRAPLLLAFTGYYHVCHWTLGCIRIIICLILVHTESGLIDFILILHLPPYWFSIRFLSTSCPSSSSSSSSSSSR